ncbi:conserved hypothetical protein [Capnocytophaga canis]|uniref:Uncharacterized protein n=1 Tax=Capnocytophaga canis TaxID=1848903 RepID=A0A0B7I1I2_9FLAO|nr:conserved hypothetical protein [Capnocytophaga canis]CEN45553.1 conserved hypothetical protein [Capnocytophaga canis]
MRATTVLQMSVRYAITEDTAQLFMHKVRESMKSNELHKMKGKVQVEEKKKANKDKATTQRKRR